MTRLRVPRPVSGGLMLSYKCQARCRHCMYACSPDWPADWIEDADLEHGLAQLSRTIRPSPWGRDRIGLSSGLHLSGGEPFLNFKRLLRAVELAHAYRVPSLFVETNSIWCTDDEAAEAKLRQLRDAGLRGMMISVNPFYAEYVPFERTQRCIYLSQCVFGFQNVIIYQLEYFRQFVELGIHGVLPLEEYLRRARSTQALHQIEMFLMGRAARALRPYYPAQPASTFFPLPCQPPPLRAWHNHFDNYGHFMAGFCGGLSLGSWLELDRLLAEGLDLVERPVLDYLVRDDMPGLFRFAQAYGYVERADGYLSKCDLCLDIRAFLVAQDAFPELAPRQFYEHLGP
jgi:hypothetical protein